MTVTKVFDPVTDPNVDLDAPTQMDGASPLALLDGVTETGFTPATGGKLDRYVLGAELARGTFGVVFAARDTHLDRNVAIKLLLPEFADHDELAERFTREAAATARINHPGIVTILDWGTYEDGAYIVMDLLDGESLSQRLETVGRLLVPDAIEIVRQVAAALGAAHGAKVLHRDLKPDNIFLVPDPSMPGGVRVKILDFGLAKEVGARRRTGVLTVLGTPHYMSPEQIRCSTAVDQRSDIYSLGCIFFELITGRPPYIGDIEELFEAHARAEVPHAADHAYCTPQLDDLITSMLAKTAAARPYNMEAVLRTLDNLRIPRAGSSSEVAWRPQRLANIHPTLPPVRMPMQFPSRALRFTPPPPSASLLHQPAFHPAVLAVLMVACIVTGVLLATLVC